MITIVALLVTAMNVIRIGVIKKSNKTTHHYHLIVASAPILGTLPLTLGIINGIYFDLRPDDLYFPLVLDRFTFLGAFLESG